MYLIKGGMCYQNRERKIIDATLQRKRMDATLARKTDATLMLHSQGIVFITKKMHVHGNCCPAF